MRKILLVAFLLGCNSTIPYDAVVNPNEITISNVEILLTDSIIEENPKTVYYYWTYSLDVQNTGLNNQNDLEIDLIMRHRCADEVKHIESNKINLSADETQTLTFSFLYQDIVYFDKDPSHQFPWRSCYSGSYRTTSAVGYDIIYYGSGENGNGSIEIQTVPDIDVVGEDLILLPDTIDPDADPGIVA